MTTSLDSDFWEDLLNLIEDGKVIPVIGAGVVTREENQSLLYPWLARRLAERLNIAPGTLPPDPDLNAVATAYLLGRREGNALYNRLSRILREECPAPGQALRDLASISAFNLFVSTTFDPLLQRAIDLVRYHGEKRTEVHAFSPGGDEVGSGAQKDLPARQRELRDATVFHILGKVSSSQNDYVVWEEDMLEFIFALHKEMPTRLGRDFKDHGLLLLGLHFSDWLVRFFLRVTNQDRLSVRLHPAYLADGPPERMPESLVLFFGAVSSGIHVMRQDPTAFCSELARRWKERHPEPAQATLPPVEPEMPPGAIFVSYAREDESAAAAIVHGLQEKGCVVWYDRERLKVGHHYHLRFEDEVKRRCGLFLSVISSTTESTRESYYHLERNWAASRAERVVQSEEFYLPVIIDDTPRPPRHEPPSFRQVHAERLLGGTITPEFGRRIKELQNKLLGAQR